MNGKSTKTSIDLYVYLFVLSIIFFFNSAVHAQSNVRGITTDNNGKPLPNASILLLKAGDSSLVKGAMAMEGGRYHFEKIAAGSYLVASSYLGYKQAYSAVFHVGNGNMELPPLTLSKKEMDLSEVRVTGKRPFLEQKIDRTIVNIANSIVSGGGTALDALEKAPGIVVDRQNGAIAMSGKDGVVVQKNGRRIYLAMTDAMAMLQTISSDQVDRIELITNPSAKYDAEGNAGIINIQLKKNENLGTNGSISVAAGTGRYEREQASLQLNHRTNKLNLFASYGFNWGDQGYWNFDLNRDWTENGERNIVRTISPIRMTGHAHQVRAGMDFFAGKNSTLGMVWTGLWNYHREEAPADVSFRHTPGDPVYYQTHTEKNISDRKDDHSINVNFQQHIGQKDGKFSADFDMGHFHRFFDNGLLTATVIPDTSNGQRNALLTEMPVTIDIRVFSLGYNRSLGKNWKLETGIKSSWVKSDNDMKLYAGKEGSLLFDPTLSNHFQYTERINAGYVNISGKWNGRLDMQLGVRAEHTYSFGNSISQNQQVERDYLDLFPSALISRKLNESNQIILSYSYRIQRPTYQSLNPAQSYLDPFARSSGNPFLNPSYTHSFELKHGFRNKLFTSFNAAYTRDFTYTLIQPINNKQTERKPYNVGNLKQYSLVISFPLTLTPQWKADFSATGAYGLLDYTFLGTLLHAKQLYGQMNMTNSFTIGKGWTAELSGRATTPGITYGMLRTPWLGSLNISLQKRWNDHWRIRVSATDILHTDRLIGIFEGAGFYNKYSIVRDTRVVLLNLTYSFGNQKVKSHGQRKTGSEEEKGRLQ